MSSFYAEYDQSTGEILRITNAPSDPNAISVEGMYVDGYVKDGKVIPFPSERPSIFHKFDRDTLSWYDSRDISQRKDFARAERASLLAETDWTQLPDVSESVRTAYQTYRQALRDVPQQAGFPDNIVWPEKP